MTETPTVRPTGLLGVEPAAVDKPRRYQVLALSGGGYRGLFTACAIDRLETDEAPIGACVDLFAGSSIGSILAGALAVGVRASIVCEAMEVWGPEIFPAGRWKRLVPSPLRGMAVAPYRSEPLERAIDEVLGEHAHVPLAEIRSALLIPCVSQTRGATRLLRSAGLAGRAAADSISLRDAMLASAAAPTYFPPRRVADDLLIDGGLVANAPELTALCEALAQHRPLDRMYVLGVGTASPNVARTPGRSKRIGKAGWLARSLVDTTFAAQEDLAIRHCRTLLRSRYLRLDEAPSRHQGEALALDRADERAASTLRAIADTCVDRVSAGAEGRWIRNYLSHRAAITLLA